jgi:hypothetical protein
VVSRLRKGAFLSAHFHLTLLACIHLTLFAPTPGPTLAARAPRAEGRVVEEVEAWVIRRRRIRKGLISRGCDRHTRTSWSYKHLVREIELVSHKENHRKLLLVDSSLANSNSCRAAHLGVGHRRARAPLVLSPEKGPRVRDCV